MDVVGVGPTGLARIVGAGAKRQHVEYWRQAGRVPPQAVKTLVAACNGVVREWDLCPDDWMRIWPDLIDANGAPKIEAKA